MIELKIDGAISSETVGSEEELYDIVIQTFEEKGLFFGGSTCGLNEDKDTNIVIPNSQEVLSDEGRYLNNIEEVATLDGESMMDLVEQFNNALSVAERQIEDLAILEYNRRQQISALEGTIIELRKKVTLMSKYNANRKNIDVAEEQFRLGDIIVAFYNNIYSNKNLDHKSLTSSKDIILYYGLVDDLREKLAEDIVADWVDYKSDGITADYVGYRDYKCKDLHTYEYTLYPFQKATDSFKSMSNLKYCIVFKVHE